MKLATPISHFRTVQLASSFGWILSVPVTPRTISIGMVIHARHDISRSTIGRNQRGMRRSRARNPTEDYKPLVPDHRNHSCFLLRGGFRMTHGNIEGYFDIIGLNQLQTIGGTCIIPPCDSNLTCPFFYFSSF